MKPLKFTPVLTTCSVVGFAIAVAALRAGWSTHTFRGSPVSDLYLGYLISYLRLAGFSLLTGVAIGLAIGAAVGAFALFSGRGRFTLLNRGYLAGFIVSTFSLIYMMQTGRL